MTDKMRIYANSKAKDLKPASADFLAAMNSMRGFSLIEVMVVIGIIGVISAIAIPAFSTWIDHNGVNNAKSSLMITLKKARNLAVAEGRSIYVVFDTVNQTFTYDADTTGTCTPCKNEVIALSRFSSRLTIQTNKNPIKFTSKGTTAGGGTVTVGKGGYNKTVTVNMIGKAHEN